MMQNNGLDNASLTRLSDAVSPVLDSGISLREMRVVLAEMFSNSVSHAPDDEVDNFTAKRQTPVYLALHQFLEKLQEAEM